MKALVFKGVGDIALEDINEPVLKDPTDALVKITTTTICGTDLHAIRGTIPGYQKDTVLGHEGVGIVEKVGEAVKNFKVGDRVIIPSTIACGKCDYCSREIYSQCDKANPQGPDAGTPYYGGPSTSGPFEGMQAEKVRVPYADVSLIKVPDELSDEQVILLSDILPTAYMAVEMADPQPDDTVAVFGCGPVGQLVIACLKQMQVKHIFAIDRIPYRLKKAESQGAKTINFDEVDPVETLKTLTNGRGPTKIIDAVGIDAEQPHYGIVGWFTNMAERHEFDREVSKVAPKTNPNNGNWVPGSGPSQVLRWAVQAIAKGGTLSIIGVYTPLLDAFSIGQAMGKNLIIRMGNCNHKKYIPMLLEWVKDGRFNAANFITQRLPFDQVVDAYKHFDKREDGWLKVLLSVQEKK